MRRSLLAALLVAACGPTAPAPVLVGKASPAETGKSAPEPAPPAPAATAPEPPPAIKREPPLTPEEIQLIEADPKTLTPEERRLRSHALRRKILQNPDSPQAKQLEELRRDVESGAVVPQLPGHPAANASSSDQGLVLQARPPAAPAPAAEKAP